ncbi:phage baseplate assembly protein [Beijerinckia sp. L45]|uniref:phage baseplate assembly protein n=1 Tax=Beijerinckia sp. L45 TaxID=1641855 RepID=UPI00131BE71E|nr:phage baseplate assembly protein [Beijerinckia sp. L45]
MSETSLFRIEHISADDTGDIQTVTAYGHASEQLEGIIRVQPHGFSSNPPVGSHGMGLRLRGESDLAVALGLEDPTSRTSYAKGQNPGDCVLYNADGSVWKMVGKSPSFSCLQTCTLTATSFVFKCGGTTFTLSADGFVQTGGAQKHNDHDVGATHQHTDVTPGSSTSGPPQ